MFLQKELKRSPLDEVIARVILSEPRRRLLNSIEILSGKQAPLGYRAVAKSVRALEKGEVRNLSRLEKETGTKYASLFRIANRLEQQEIIVARMGNRKRKEKFYETTLLGVVLFADIVSDCVLRAFFSTVLGRENDFVDFLSNNLNMPMEEAEAIVYYLCKNGVDFVNFVRDFFFLPYYRQSEMFPHLWQSQDYWRNASMMYIFMVCVTSPRFLWQSKKSISSLEVPDKLLASASLRIYDFFQDIFENEENKRKVKFLSNIPFLITLKKKEPNHEDSHWIGSGAQGYQISVSSKASSPKRKKAGFVRTRNSSS